MPSTPAVTMLFPSCLPKKVEAWIKPYPSLHRPPNPENSLRTLVNKRLNRKTACQMVFGMLIFLSVVIVVEKFLEIESWGDRTLLTIIMANIRCPAALASHM